MQLQWEQTKEGDTLHGARLTIETGARFPIGIDSGPFSQNCMRILAQLGSENTLYRNNGIQF